MAALQEGGSLNAGGPFCFLLCNPAILQSCNSSERVQRMKSAIEIANSAELLPITDVAAAAGILPDELIPFGRDRGKVRLSILERLAAKPDGKLIIVTAITPTKAGEGKTTTSIALTQGLGKLKKNVMLCLREPSMGPVFGVKGGGTGGGYSQIGPMEDINLHFNGDFHAVTTAHNLLAAALTPRCSMATRCASIPRR